MMELIVVAIFKATGFLAGLVYYAFKAYFPGKPKEEVFLASQLTEKPLTAAQTTELEAKDSPYPAPIAKDKAEADAVRASQPVDPDSGEMAFLGKNQYLGVVMSAETVTVAPEGREPFKTFQVILHNKGQETAVSGTQLKELFYANRFTIGQTVRIKKITTQFSVRGNNGQTSKRTKNVFDVVVVS